MKQLLDHKYSGVKDDAEKLRCLVKDKDVDSAVHAEAAAQLKKLELILAKLAKAAGDSKVTGEVCHQISN